MSVNQCSLNDIFRISKKNDVFMKLRFFFDSSAKLFNIMYD